MSIKKFTVQNKNTNSPQQSHCKLFIHRGNKIRNRNRQSNSFPACVFIFFAKAGWSSSATLSGFLPPRNTFSLSLHTHTPTPEDVDRLVVHVASKLRLKFYLMLMSKMTPCSLASITCLYWKKLFLVCHTLHIQLQIQHNLSLRNFSNWRSTIQT